MIDYRVVYGLFSFAIPPSQGHLLAVWEPAFDIVLEVVGEYKAQWLTLEMLYRGLKGDAAHYPETIVIISPSAGDDVCANTVLPSIRKRVESLSSSLDIELLCGASLCVDSKGGMLNAQAYEQDVLMGISVGQQDLGKHSGTAGGVVKLLDGATYALTNHHVVCNNGIDRRQ